MTYLTGCAGEKILADTLISAGCKPIRLNSTELIKTACSFHLGVKRFQKAMPDFLDLYSHLLKSQPLTWEKIPQQNTQEYILSLFHWSKVPGAIIVDWIFGCDFLGNYRGYILGFDSTTRKSAVSEKSIKVQQGRLKPLWQAIGIEQFAIAFVHSPVRVPATTIKPQLSRVIKGKCHLIEL